MAKRFKKFGKGAFAKARRGQEAGVFIVDDVTSFYTIAAKNFPKETSRALRHISYLVHVSAKRYMANDSHGKKLSKVSTSRVLDKFAGRGSKRKKKHAGDLSTRSQGLARAIKYDSEKGDRMSYLVGWASKDARRVSGPRFQGGVNTRKMDDSMRRFLMGAALTQPKRSEMRKILLGMAMKRIGHVFKNPSREVIDPVYNSWKGKILPVFEKRLMRNLNRLDDESYTAFLTDITTPDQNQREAVEVAQGIRTRAGNLRKGRRSA